MLISLRLSPNPWDTKPLILKWPGVPSVHANHSMTLIPSWITTARNRVRLINLMLLKVQVYGLCGFTKNIRVLQINMRITCREINPLDSVIHLFNN